MSSPACFSLRKRVASAVFLLLSPAAMAAGPTRPDIILVSFDTLRRDHVSCYGAERLTTPRIDALAASGVRFTNAVGVVPLTGPSHATILTGLNPQEHGAFRNGVKLDPAKVTLPKLLAAEGYTTAAIVSGWTLKRSQVGLDTSFQTYDDEGMEERYSVVNLMRRADKVTDGALRWADRQVAAASEAPYFLFVHYFDPHEPYESPILETPGPNPAAGGFQVPKHPQQLPAYDREIAFADRELGRLLDGLKTRGLLDNAVIVFTADHGQAFGDHGYGGPEGAHGRRVYQDQVLVPLIVSMPAGAAGAAAGGRSSDLPVSHVDIMPTLAALGGIAEKALPVGLPGHSLASVLLDPAAPPPWGNARRVRHGVTYRGAVGNKWNIFRWAMNTDVEAAEPIYAFGIQDGKKLIVDFTPRHSIEVYDLVNDPWEAKPLSRDEVPGRDAWAQAVLDWYARTKSADLRAAQPTGAELENLRSLGYVE